MTARVLAHYPHRRAVHGLHVCGDCRGYIARGDHYSDQRLADNGTAYTYREHALCRALFEEICNEGWFDDDCYDSADMDLPDWWREFVATFAPGAGEHR